jgi:PAS domain S-box-containing protein
MPGIRLSDDHDLHVMTRLYEVGVTCARVESAVEDCLNAILGAAIELAKAKCGTISLVAGNSRQIVTSTSEGWSKDSLALWSNSMDSLPESLLAKLQAGERIILSDAREAAESCNEPIRDLCVATGIAAINLTPLIGRRGQLFGILTICFSTRYEPTARDLRISDLLARQATDYLERRHVEAEVQANEERFRAFVGATSDIVYRMSSDWTRVRHLQGRNILADTFEPTDDWLEKYIPADERERLAQAIRQAIESKSMFELEHRVLRQDGSVGLMYSRAIPFVEGNGRITEWFGAATDVTQQRQAEEAVRVSEARYRTLFESIDQGYCIIRILFDSAGHAYDYVFEEVNQSFECQTGLRGAEGTSMRSLAPEHEAHWFEVYGKIALTGESQRFELVAHALNRWYDVYAYRIGEPGERRVAILFQDISDRKRAEAALTEADRLKDEFLATLAHELRNPLAPMQTGIEIIKRSGDQPPVTANVMQMLERQVKHMAHLVDDLLEVSRISRGTIALSKQRIDLGAVLHSAVETSRPLIDAAGHRLVIELPGQPMFVNGDSVRLSQIVANLLNNAAKYTDSGGTIELTAYREGGSAVVVVRDNGIGIPHAMLSKVFEWFVQVDRAHRRAQGGLGVGLTLVRSLVEMHGGTVEARSEGPGQGSEFIVRLPLVGAGGSADTNHVRLSEHKPIVSRILIVDDNQDAAQSLCMLLQLYGAHVKALYDGASALAALDEFQPDVILLDLGMPGMSGYELAQKIRARADGHRYTLIAITGWTQDEDRLRSSEAGIDRHLVKPVDMTALEQLLK